MLFLFAFLLKAQPSTKEDSLSFYFHESLSFLENTQEDSTIEGKQYAGEWSVDMQLTVPFLFIGKKQKVRDSNCFTVAAIHNFISEIYLDDTSLVQLKPVLEEAFKEIKTYENKGKFNFWKKLPPNRKLKLFNNPKPSPLVHRPTNYRLRSRFINNAANVPEDADDTSLGNLAKLYQNRIFNENETLITANEFDHWQDSNRKNKQWYNYFFLDKEETKAYLTWLWQEHEYNKWNPAKTILNTFFIFIPGSTAKPKPYSPWIPFGANDVDPVVNCNILSYLAISNQLDESEVANSSMAFLNQLTQGDAYWDKAIYYPNSFHFFYALARAQKNGVQISEKAKNQLKIDLVSLQNENGSYASSRYLTGGDVVQSTAYALHAMLDLKANGIDVSDNAIDKAIEFLLANSFKDENGIHWKGGVYFSGGTILRHTLLWKSDAYTTALIARCIQKYQILLDQKL